jgi:hypothetical protein
MMNCNCFTAKAQRTLRIAKKKLWLFAQDPVEVAFALLCVLCASAVNYFHDVGLEI